MISISRLRGKILGQAGRMMTAMARTPCKSATTQQQQQQTFRENNNSYSNTNRNYWDMQRQPSLPLTYTRAQHRQTIDHTGKRKSAVELLQESKAFYVKSEIVLDRKQELKNSGHLQVAPSTNAGAPPRLLRKCTNIVSCSVNLQQQQQQQSLSMSCSCAGGSVGCSRSSKISDGILSPQRTLPPVLPPKSPRLISVPQRRAISGPPSTAGGDQLQAKLRKLLNTDSKENIHFIDSPGSINNYSIRGNASNVTSLPPKSPSPSPSPSGQLSPAVNCQLSPRSGQSNLSVEVRFKFGRSHSHSHTSTKNHNKSNSGISSPPAICQTTICHKSLPDLHTSARRRASLSPRASTKSSSKPINVNVNCPDCETSSDYSDQSFKRDSICYQSSRHMRRSVGSAGGNDANSVLSSGGRTQKSSGSSKLSHGATARDSGGSSGHCTHRSEPPPRIQECWGHIRRDSGASTQHSTDKDRSRRGSSHVSGGTPPTILRNLSIDDSESSNSPTDYSSTRNLRFSDGWKEGRGRPILRSKSDISDRYWRHDNSGANTERKKKPKQQHVQQQQQQPPPPPPRPPKSIAELENFFDRLGLDSDNYDRIIVPLSNSSSPVFFDSVSSVDSALGLYSWSGHNQSSSNNDGQWQGNNCSATNEETSQRVSDPPSIVERNARIIKWLCQCRKTQFGYS
ncbi:type-2 histone deacetylase 1 [Diachasmimorpha longicaudata]|uniref:type-2 histone deacetylase 1 n=1 Tax=Diachasmimorpha longicaudata TaxID=58733 RepID=UPI0030B8982D